MSFNNFKDIIQEGIFRRTGKLTRQQDLKITMYQGIPLNLNDGRYSVHDCASVLKGFLAELPEPLLSDLHYPAHCQIAGKMFINLYHYAFSYLNYDYVFVCTFSHFFYNLIFFQYFRIMQF